MAIPHACNGCRAEAQFALAVQAAEAAVGGGRACIAPLPGPVRGIVVDDQDFGIGQDRVYLVNQPRQVVDFVVRGDGNQRLKPLTCRVV